MAGDAIKTSPAATLVTGMPESLGRCVEVSGQDGVLVTKFVSAHNYAILPAQNEMFVKNCENEVGYRYAFSIWK